MYKIENYKDKYSEDTYKAIEMWNNGQPYCCSIGIDDNPTYGYGQLDNNGYWEFHFPESLANIDIIAAENKMRWKQNE